MRMKRMRTLVVVTVAMLALTATGLAATGGIKNCRPDRESVIAPPPHHGHGDRGEHGDGNRGHGKDASRNVQAKKHNG